jgi:hypothetical protein
VIVDPVFGILKHVEGFRRWTAWGLENVRTRWALVCTACNLNKLWKNWKKGLTAATGPLISTAATPPSGAGLLSLSLDIVYTFHGNTPSGSSRGLCFGVLPLFLKNYCS